MTMIADIEVPENLIPAEQVELVGVSSGAGSIMAVVSEGLKEAGNSIEVIDNYRRQAMSGDYNHLIRASMVFCGYEMN